MSDAEGPPRAIEPQGTSADTPSERLGDSFASRVVRAVVSVVLTVVVVGVTGVALVVGLVLVTCSR